MKSNTRTVLIYGSFICLIALISNKNPIIPANYKGVPYADSLYKGGPQLLPGKLQCEYYDKGGEGISFHDDDKSNSGSGDLNPKNGTYLNEFRINEPVDISYTKFDNKGVKIDDSPYNFVETTKNQLYVGWTKKGEWLKYTVNVKTKGTYIIGLMYTSNKNGKIALSVNDKAATGEITVPSTFVEKETVAWRQWHHWNYIDNIAEVKLKKGLQVITLHTVDIGDMNYDYLNFKLK